MPLIATGLCIPSQALQCAPRAQKFQLTLQSMHMDGSCSRRGAELKAQGYYIMNLRSHSMCQKELTSTFCFCIWAFFVPPCSLTPIPAATTPLSYILVLR